MKKTTLKFLAFVALGLPLFVMVGVSELVENATGLEVPGRHAAEDLLFWSLGR